MSIFMKRFLIGLLIIDAIVILVVSIWAINATSYGEYYKDSLSPKINSITIDYVDKDGTIWVEVDGKLYYLYLSDNGTQQKLEWIK